MSKAREYLEQFKEANRAVDAEVSSSGVYFSEQDVLIMLTEHAESLRKRVDVLEDALQMLYVRLQYLVDTERVNVNRRETIRDLNIAEEILTKEDVE